MFNKRQDLTKHETSGCVKIALISYKCRLIEPTLIITEHLTISDEFID